MTEQTFSIEEFDNFPFNNFKEYQEAILNGDISIGMFPSTTIDIGRIAAPNLYTYLRVSIIIPAILFIVFAIISSSWLFLGYLLLLPIAFFISNPSTRIIPFRNLIVFLTHLLFIYAIFSTSPKMFIVTSGLLFTYYSFKIFLRKIYIKIVKLSGENEKFLYRLWETNSINLQNKDGKIHWNRQKS